MPTPEKWAEIETLLGYTTSDSASKEKAMKGLKEILELETPVQLPAEVKKEEVKKEEEKK